MEGRVASDEHGWTQMRTSQASPDANGTPASLSAFICVHLWPLLSFCLLAAPLCLCVQSASAQTDWWRDAVFYEVFVRSFADSTEGPLAGDGVGDLRGLIERLDTLNDGDPTTDTDLGVTALWLMPICQSPSYHGYDVVDYLSVDDEYGTNEDFRDLVEAAHARGMRVIVDTVINHSSSEHPWFVESREPASSKRDWYVWSDEPLEVEWGSTVWHRPRAQTGEHYFGLFWRGMPDLNLQNPDTTRAVHELSRFWLTDLRADGFRLDAAKHLIEVWPRVENTQETIDWLKDYRRAMKGARPDAFLIGEVWADAEQVARYIPDALDAAFEFDLAFAIVEGVRDGDAGRIRDAIATAQASYPHGQFATFLANHDMQRTMTTLRETAASEDEALAKARLCATIQLTLPGIPFIYYGEEIGMTGAKPDPDLRTPMQWTGDARTAGFTDGEPWRRPNADTASVNVAAQDADPGSLLSVYRDLIRRRQAHADLWRSPLTLIDTGNPDILAYGYALDGFRLIVAANCSDRVQSGVRVTPEGEGGPIGPLSLKPWGTTIVTVAN